MPLLKGTSARGAVDRPLPAAQESRVIAPHYVAMWCHCRPSRQSCRCPAGPVPGGWADAALATSRAAAVHRAGRDPILIGAAAQRSATAHLLQPPSHLVRHRHHGCVGARQSQRMGRLRSPPSRGSLLTRMVSAKVSFTVSITATLLDQKSDAESGGRLGSPQTPRGGAHGNGGDPMSLARSITVTLPEPRWATEITAEPARQGMCGR